MTKHTDRALLVAALRDAGCSDLQWRMAAILLGVNGLQAALDFVRGLQEKGLTGP